MSKTVSRQNRSIKIAAASLITIILAIGGLFWFVIDWAFYDIDGIEGHEFIAEQQSPDGKYLVKTYRNNGGATTSYSVLGELVFLKEEKEPKNIYWQNKMEEGNITWESNELVVINGTKINIPNGTYDYRHDQ